jgi:hypothetical protein
MRSQVQVLAGPPAIVAGQSAVGSKPGALAGCLGRAGAARPSPPASPSAPPGPSTWAPGASITTHSGRPPIPGTAASRPVQPPPVPSRSRRRRALRTPPGLPGRPASSTAAAHARPGPGPPPTAPPTTGDLGGVARGRACSAVGPSRSTTRQPTGTWARSRGAGCLAASACPQCHRLMGTRRTRPDGRGRPQTAGHRTGGHQTAGRQIPDDEPR